MYFFGGDFGGISSTVKGETTLTKADQEPRVPELWAFSDFQDNLLRKRSESEERHRYGLDAWTDSRARSSWCQQTLDPKRYVLSILFVLAGTLGCFFLR